MSEDRPNLVAEAVDMQMAQDPDRETDGFWHPSSISSRCARRSIYMMRGTKRSNPEGPERRRVPGVGKILHAELFQRAVPLHPDVLNTYPEAAILDLNEQVPGAVPTVGNLDELVAFIDGQSEVEEYKTKSSNMMRSKKQLEALPDEEHLIQVRLYIRAVRRYGFTDHRGKQHPPMPDLVMGRIVYLGKDTAMISEHLVTYVPERDDAELDDRLRYLEAYRQDGEALPPRLPIVVKHPKGKKAFADYDWLCKVCPWFYRCFEEDPDEIPLYEEYHGRNPFIQAGEGTSDDGDAASAD